MPKVGVRYVVDCSFNTSSDTTLYVRYGILKFRIRRMEVLQTDKERLCSQAEKRIYKEAENQREFLYINGLKIESIDDLKDGFIDELQGGDHLQRFILALCLERLCRASLDKELKEISEGNLKVHDKQTGAIDDLKRLYRRPEEMLHKRADEGIHSRPGRSLYLRAAEMSKRRM